MGRANGFCVLCIPTLPFLSLSLLSSSLYFLPFLPLPFFAAALASSRRRICLRNHRWILLANGPTRVTYSSCSCSRLASASSSSARARAQWELEMELKVGAGRRRRGTGSHGDVK